MSTLRLYLPILTWGAEYTRSTSANDLSLVKGQVMNALWRSHFL